MPNPSKISWEEYQYRHNHIWNNIYKLTFAVALLSVIPYLHKEVVCVLAVYALWSPALAVALCLFGIVRGYRELKILNTIKIKYRIQQRTFKKLKTGWFCTHTMIYLLLLLAAASLNGYVMYVKWIPAVSQSEASLCITQKNTQASIDVF